MDSDFLEWNFRNILTNLLQTEDHLKVLEPTGDPKHHSCIQKHMMITSGELGEAIAHSSTTRPEIAEEIKEKKAETDALLSKFEHGITDTVNALKNVRSLRKSIEKLHPTYDTSSCLACGNHEKSWEEALNNKTHKHRISTDTFWANSPQETKGDTMPLFSKQDVSFIGGQAVNEAVRVLEDRIPVFAPTIGPVSGKRWQELGLGALVLIASSKLGKKQKTNFVVKLVGAGLIARGVVGVITDFTGTTRATAFAVPRAVAAPANMSVSSNGMFIQVDK